MIEKEPDADLNDDGLFARRLPEPPAWLLPSGKSAVRAPGDWIARVNRPQSKKELEAIRTSVKRGRPDGEDRWQHATAKKLSLESTLRPRGRQRVRKIKDSRPLRFSRRNPFSFSWDEPDEWIHIPVLGELARRKDKPWIWHGITRCEPALNFLNAAERRAKFRTDPEEFGPMTSRPSWDIARGEFELNVFTNGTGSKSHPSSAQVRAFERFRRREAQYFDQIIAAIFDDYSHALERRRAEWERPHIDARLAKQIPSVVMDIAARWGRPPVDDCLPTLQDAQGLRDRLELASINLMPASKSSPRQADIGLEFFSSWQFRFGVRWRDGKVVRIGKMEVARPDGFRRKKRADRSRRLLIW